MTITLDLTPEEETQLKTVASARGVEPEEHAHTLLANLLRRDSTPQQDQPSDQEERLMTLARAGNVAAKLQLLERTPLIPTHDPKTGEAYPAITDEALRRENIYEDRA